MRIVDDANRVPEWIREDREANAFADIRDRSPNRGAYILQTSKRTFDVSHTPASDRSTSVGWSRYPVRIQPKLEPADRIANVERLVEVRILAQERAVPPFGARQVGDGIYNGT